MLRLTKASFPFALFLSLLFHGILLFISFPSTYLSLRKSENIPSISKADKTTTSTITLSQLPAIKDPSEIQIGEYAEKDSSVVESIENIKEYSDTEEDKILESETNESSFIKTQERQEDLEIREDQQFEEKRPNNETILTDSENVQEIQEDPEDRQKRDRDENLEASQEAQENHEADLANSENVQEIQEDQEETEQKDREENLEASQEAQENWDFEVIGTTDEEAAYSYNLWTDRLRSFGVTIVSDPIPKPNVLTSFPSSACHLEGALSWASVFALYPDLENKVPQEDQVMLVQSSGYEPFNQLAFEEVSQKEISDAREGHIYIVAVTFQYDSDTCKSV